jgi:DNA repair exonuclease SbcCD ATPase subunit
MGFTYTLSVDEKKTVDNLNKFITNTFGKNGLKIPIQLDIKSDFNTQQVQDIQKKLDSLYKGKLKLNVAVSINMDSITKTAINKAQTKLDSFAEKLTMKVDLQISDEALSKFSTSLSIFKEMNKELGSIQTKLNNFNKKISINIGNIDLDGQYKKVEGTTKEIEKTNNAVVDKIREQLIQQNKTLSNLKQQLNAKAEEKRLEEEKVEAMKKAQSIAEKSKSDVKDSKQKLDTLNKQLETNDKIVESLERQEEQAKKTQQAQQDLADQQEKSAKKIADLQDKQIDAKTVNETAKAEQKQHEQNIKLINDEIKALDKKKEKLDELGDGKVVSANKPTKQEADKKVETNESVKQVETVANKTVSSIKKVADVTNEINKQQNKTAKQTLETEEKVAKTKQQTVNKSKKATQDQLKDTIKQNEIAEAINLENIEVMRTTKEMTKYEKEVYQGLLEQRNVLREKKRDKRDISEYTAEEIRQEQQYLDLLQKELELNLPNTTNTKDYAGSKSNSTKKMKKYGLNENSDTSKLSESERAEILNAQLDETRKNVANRYTRDLLKEIGDLQDKFNGKLHVANELQDKLNTKLKKHEERQEKINESKAKNKASKLMYPDAKSYVTEEMFGFTPAQLDELIEEYEEKLQFKTKSGQIDDVTDKTITMMEKQVDKLKNSLKGLDGENLTKVQKQIDKLTKNITTFKELMNTVQQLHALLYEKDVNREFTILDDEAEEDTKQAKQLVTQSVASMKLYCQQADEYVAALDLIRHASQELRMEFGFLRSDLDKNAKNNDEETWTKLTERMKKLQEQVGFTDAEMQSYAEAEQKRKDEELKAQKELEAQRKKAMAQLESQANFLKERINMLDVESDGYEKCNKALKSYARVSKNSNADLTTTTKLMKEAMEYINNADMGKDSFIPKSKKSNISNAKNELATQKGITQELNKQTKAVADKVEKTKEFKKVVATKEQNMLVGNSLYDPKINEKREIDGVEWVIKIEHDGTKEDMERAKKDLDRISDYIDSKSKVIESVREMDLQTNKTLERNFVFTGDNFGIGNLKDYEKEFNKVFGNAKRVTDNYNKKQLGETVSRTQAATKGLESQNQAQMKQAQTAKNLVNQQNNVTRAVNQTTKAHNEQANATKNVANQQAKVTRELEKQAKIIKFDSDEAVNFSLNNTSMPDVTFAKLEAMLGTYMDTEKGFIPSFLEMPKEWKEEAEHLGMSYEQILEEQFAKYTYYYERAAELEEELRILKDKIEKAGGDPRKNEEYRERYDGITGYLSRARQGVREAIQNLTDIKKASQYYDFDGTREELEKEFDERFEFTKTFKELEADKLEEYMKSSRIRIDQAEEEADTMVKIQEKAVAKQKVTPDESFRKSILDIANDEFDYYSTIEDKEERRAEMLEDITDTMKHYGKTVEDVIAVSGKLADLFKDEADTTELYNVQIKEQAKDQDTLASKYEDSINTMKRVIESSKEFKMSGETAQDEWEDVIETIENAKVEDTLDAWCSAFKDISKYASELGILDQISEYLAPHLKDFRRATASSTKESRKSANNEIKKVENKVENKIEEPNKEVKKSSNEIKKSANEVKKASNIIKQANNEIEESSKKSTNEVKKQADKMQEVQASSIKTSKQVDSQKQANNEIEQSIRAQADANKQKTKQAEQQLNLAQQQTKELHKQLAITKDITVQQIQSMLKTYTTSGGRDWDFLYRDSEYDIRNSSKRWRQTFMETDNLHKIYRDKANMDKRFLRETYMDVDKYFSLNTMDDSQSEELIKMYATYHALGNILDDIRLKVEALDFEHLKSYEIAEKLEGNLYDGENRIIAVQQIRKKLTQEILGIDEKILKLQSTKPTDAQIEAEEEKLRVLEKQREEMFQSAEETQKYYKSIRDMGLDPLHKNGWKIIETEKMHATYAAKAGMGDYINNEGINITKVIEEENAYKDLDVEISRINSKLADMRSISEDINNLTFDRMGIQEQINKWLKVEEDLSNGIQLETVDKNERWYRNSGVIKNQTKEIQFQQDTIAKTEVVLESLEQVAKSTWKALDINEKKGNKLPDGVLESLRQSIKELKGVDPNSLAWSDIARQNIQYMESMGLATDKYKESLNDLIVQVRMADSEDMMDAQEAEFFAIVADYVSDLTEDYSTLAGVAKTAYKILADGALEGKYNYIESIVDAYDALYRIDDPNDPRHAESARGLIEFLDEIGQPTEKLKQALNSLQPTYEENSDAISNYVKYLDTLQDKFDEVAKSVNMNWKDIALENFKELLATGQNMPGIIETNVDFATQNKTMSLADEDDFFNKDELYNWMDLNKYEEENLQTLEQRVALLAEEAAKRKVLEALKRKQREDDIANKDASQLYNQVMEKGMDDQARVQEANNKLLQEEESIRKNINNLQDKAENSKAREEELRKELLVLVEQHRQLMSNSQELQKYDKYLEEQARATGAKTQTDIINMKKNLQNMVDMNIGYERNSKGMGLDDPNTELSRMSKYGIDINKFLTDFDKLAEVNNKITAVTTELSDLTGIQSDIQRQEAKLEETTKRRADIEEKITQEKQSQAKVTENETVVVNPEEVNKETDSLSKLKEELKDVNDQQDKLQESSSKAKELLDSTTSEKPNSLEPQVKAIEDLIDKLTPTQEQKGGILEKLGVDDKATQNETNQLKELTAQAQDLKEELSESSNIKVLVDKEPTNVQAIIEDTSDLDFGETEEQQQAQAEQMAKARKYRQDLAKQRQSEVQAIDNQIAKQEQLLKQEEENLTVAKNKANESKKEEISLQQQLKSEEQKLQTQQQVTESKQESANVEAKTTEEAQQTLEAKQEELNVEKEIEQTKAKEKQTNDELSDAIREQEEIVKQKGQEYDEILETILDTTEAMIKQNEEALAMLDNQEEATAKLKEIQQPTSQPKQPNNTPTTPTTPTGGSGGGGKGGGKTPPDLPTQIRLAQQTLNLELKKLTANRELNEENKFMVGIIEQCITAMKDEVKTSEQLKTTIADIKHLMAETDFDISLEETNKKLEKEAEAQRQKEINNSLKERQKMYEYLFASLDKEEKALEKEQATLEKQIKTYKEKMELALREYEVKNADAVDHQALASLMSQVQLMDEANMSAEEYKRTVDELNRAFADIKINTSQTRVENKLSEQEAKAMQKEQQAVDKLNLAIEKEIATKQRALKEYAQKLVTSKAMINATEEEKRVILELANTADLVSDSVKGVDIKFEQLKETMNDMKFNVVNQQLEKQESIFSRLGNSIKDYVRIYFDMGDVIQYVTQGFRNAYDYVKELDAAYTNINMTMEVSKKEFLTMKDTALAVGKQYGVLSTDVLEMMKIYANANETAESINKKVAGTVAFQNVTGLGGTEATNAVQTIMNQFQLLEGGARDTGEAIQYLGDVLVGASYSLSKDEGDAIKEIVSAVEDAGSVIYQAGGSLEWYSAVAGVLAEQMNATGSEVGGAMRMITARTLQQKGAFESLSEGGEDTEEAMANAEKALKKVGVSIRDTGGDLRSIEDILGDVASKWDTLSDADQQFVAEKLAGTTRRAYFMGLMENYDRLRVIQNEALNSNGAMMKASEKQAQSLEGRLNTLQTALHELYSTMMTSDAVSGGISALTSITEGATSLLKVIGDLTPTFVGLGVAMLAMNWSSVIGFVSSLTAKFVGLAGTITGVTSAVTLLKFGLIGLGAGAVFAGLSWVFNKIKETNDVIKNATSSANNLHNALNQNTDVEELINKYRELGKELENETLTQSERISKEEEIVKLKEQLCSISEKYNSLLQDETMSYQEQANALENMNAYDREKTIRQALKDTDISDTRKQSMVTDTDAQLGYVQELDAKIAQEKSDIESINHQLGNINISEEERNRLLEERANIESNLATDTDLRFNTFSKMLETVQSGQAINDVITTALENGIPTDEKLVGFSQEVLAYIDNALQEAINSPEADTANAQGNLVEEVEPPIDATKSAKELNAEYVKTLQLLEEAKGYVEALADGMSVDEMNSILNSDIMSDFTGNISNAAEVIDYINSKIEGLETTAGNVFNSMNAQSTEFWNNNMRNSDAWLQYEAGLYDAFQNLAVQAMGAEGQAFADMIDYKTLLRDVDLSNASTMAEAQNILESTLVSNLLSGWQSYVNSKAGARSVDAANVAEFLNWQGSQEITTINQLIQAWNEFYRMKIAAVESTRAELNALTYTIGAGLNAGNTANLSTSMMTEQELQARTSAIEGGNKILEKYKNAVNELNAMKLNNPFEGFSASIQQVGADLGQATAGLGNFKDALGNALGEGKGGSGGGNGGSGGGSGDGSGTEQIVEDLEDIRDLFYDIDNALKDVSNRMTLVETKMKNAYGSDYLNLHKEKLSLLQKESELLLEQKGIYEQQASSIRDELISEGFAFADDGSLTNYMSQFEYLRGWANSLAGDEKEEAKQHVQDLMDKVNEYTSLIKDEIPQIANEWEDMANRIKEAERDLAETATNTQKEVEDAIEHYMNKRYEAIKEELEKEKELYNNQYEEDEYQDNLAKEQRKLDEIQQQINNLMRDTTEAGKLKLEDLKQQYLEQQESINDMIKQHEKDKVNDRFDEELDALDKELEDLMKPENLINMINEAITSGFITIGDETVALQGIMDTWLNETGDGLYALGDILRTELCENLLTAQAILADMGITSLGAKVTATGTQQLASSEAILQGLLNGGIGNSNTVEQSIVFDSPLVVVEGNVAQDTLPDLERMIKKAQDEVIAKIARQLKTK